MTNLTRFTLLLFMTTFSGVALAQQVVAPNPEPYARAFDGNRGVHSYSAILEDAIKAVVKLHRMEYSEKHERYTPTSSGSGVIYNRERGLIITNEHVTGKAKKMVVEFDSGDWTWANVLGESTVVDIAVVQVEDYQLKHQATFVDTNTIQVGDLAFAAGFPQHLKKTLTSGIVSGLERRQFGSRPGKPKIEDFIQTDAAINGGNSGGALLDSHGRVMGINTFILKESEGLGFAIPSNIAIKVVRRLLQGLNEAPGFFGATVENVTFADVERLDLDINSGVVLKEVKPGSPAYKAGLRDEDVIIGAGSRAIADVYQFANYILLADSGVANNLYYRRKGKKLVASVLLEDRSGKRNGSKQNVPELNSSGSRSNTGKLHGATLLETISGSWLITAVQKGSRASRKGLLEGDRIVSINGRSVRFVSNFRDAISKMSKSSTGLSIERDGRRFTIVL